MNHVNSIGRNPKQTNEPTYLVIRPDFFNDESKGTVAKVGVSKPEIMQPVSQSDGL